MNARPLDEPLKENDHDFENRRQRVRLTKPRFPKKKRFPSVTATGTQRYRAEGLMFHMPGRWEYIFEVRAAGAIERLTTSVVMP